MPIESRVFIAIPHGDTLHPEVLRSVVEMINHPSGCKLNFQMRQGHLASETKNYLAEQFLTSDSTHLLLMDADNPPLNNPLTLAALGHDIVGCPTPIYKDEAMELKTFPITWNVYRADGEEYRPIVCGKGIEECDAIGAGCIMISRRVVETLKPLFLWQQKKKTRALGDDLAFCQRALRHGFNIYAAWTHLCSHYHQTDLLKMMQAGMDLVEAFGTPKEASE